MRLQRVQITNYQALGEKVKAWAKGQDALPSDMAELKEQLAAAQVGATIPERIKNVKFVRCEDDTLVIKLPPKSLIEDSESRFTQPGGDYPLPPVYEQVFQAKPAIKDKMAFHAERIGDYTIALCA